MIFDPCRSVLRRSAFMMCSAAFLMGCKPVSGWLSTRAKSPGGVKWAAFYGESTDEHLLSQYDLIVLDLMFKGSLDAATRADTRACCYLSVGEIRTNDPFYDRVDPAALLEENPAWPSTRRIDVRHKAWRALILGRVIPQMREKGFSGLMLDTLDTPAYLEQCDPVARHGMSQAAVDLVLSIRRSYPDLLVIMNRGYAMLPAVSGHIDGIVAESLLTTTAAGEPATYVWNQVSEVALQLSLLNRGLLRNRLPILSLDYWSAEDLGTIEQIYLRERQLGHHPYVGTRMLDRIVTEPFAQNSRRS